MSNVNYMYVWICLKYKNFKVLKTCLNHEHKQINTNFLKLRQWLNILFLIIR